MIAVAELALSFLEKLEAVLDPLLPGSEQFSLQQRRAIETSDAWAVDLAFLQQRGIFLSAEDPSSALTPTAAPAMATIIAKLKARVSIPGELYLAGRATVKIVYNVRGLLINYRAIIC
jgi:hypothetical protein